MHSDALRPAENLADGVHAGAGAGAGADAGADSSVLELYLADTPQSFDLILCEARLFDRPTLMPVSLLGADAPVGHAA